MTDNELLALVSRNNQQAFDQIYSRYWEKLFLYTVKVIRDEDDAKDLVQELFVSLWLRREELHSIGSLSAYLFTAARYKGLSYIQANVNKNNYSESLSTFLSGQQEHPDDQQSANELRQIIDHSVDGLPDKMRAVFSLSRTDGLSHKQISEKLGISDKTVKKQIGNAIKLIRMKLADKNLSVIWMLIFTGLKIK